MHDLRARPLVYVLFVDGDYRVTVPKPRAMTGRSRRRRENIDVIVALGDGNADAVDAAALFGLNLVEFSFGEERRMRIKRMKHSLYRVLAKHLEVNLSGVALLYLGDCLLEIL